ETGGIWKTYGKTVLSYDDDDHVTLAMYYGYVDGEWMESSKETWDYEDGLLQSNTTYYINENGEWVGDRRTEYHYDGDGLCTEMIVSQWSEIWYYESKTVYHFDAQQQCYEKIEYGYGEGWYELYKNTYEYDAAGNLHIETTYFYQSGAQDWTYRNRYEYLYDEDNNCTDYYEYFYYVYDETWELEEVYHTAYGTPGIEYIAGLSLMWDLFEFGFPIHNKVEQLVLDEEGDLFILDFHYSSTVGIAEQNGSVLTLWPNPARDRVVVEGIEAAEVQVYNGLGQLVKTVRNSNEISVSGLAEGVYLVQVTDTKGIVYTKKITKQ
ncbi:MAG: T9SS type A sorting domain-containing protein, partial [Bacteroidales bacterium]|nr:T9SS type A sorting domain-containing protein [Bacteroidales bacterium]